MTTGDDGGGRWLVAAAVERELAPARALLRSAPAVDYLTTGIGPVNAALALDRALGPSPRPAAVVLIGSGGAYPARGLELGDVVVASEEVFADLGTPGADGSPDLRLIGIPLAARDGVELWNEVPVARPAEGALADVAAAVRGDFRVEVGRLLTSARCAGTAALASERERRWAPWVESMEGAAAAYVAWLRDVPLLEVRGVSNAVGPRDRAAWDIDLAAAHAARVAARIIERSELPPPPSKEVSP